MFQNLSVASSVFLATSLLISSVSATSNGHVLADPQFKPAPQQSVTSTAFNPNIQNAGGSTNAAGTFNVVSLSESGSYVFDTNLPVTTTFQPDSVTFQSKAYATNSNEYYSSLNAALAAASKSDAEASSKQVQEAATSSLAITKPTGPATPTNRTGGGDKDGAASLRLPTSTLMGAGLVALAMFGGAAAVF